MSFGWIPDDIYTVYQLCWKVINEISKVLDVRKRPPTPEFPVSPSDFDEQEIEAKKNSTMTMPRSPTKSHRAGIFRGRSSTPDRARAPSPVTIPTVPNQAHMHSVPPSPRTVRMVKVMPDSPQLSRGTGRPPTPDESVVQDLSWLQHFIIWNERQEICLACATACFITFGLT
ncbi:homer [Mytilus galloprovincialis]|uniref:Homer n=1 Tax=Mytilus galloprovincialis TaxID=29158 RepID=A0A8B6EJC6_MYTGA|nr:homer [Mytilus galloprovincialis]